MKKQEEIVELHQRIVGHMASSPFLNKRYEHLRGWARALRWVLEQEDLPHEFKTTQ